MLWRVRALFRNISGALGFRNDEAARYFARKKPGTTVPGCDQGKLNSDRFEIRCGFLAAVRDHLELDFLPFGKAADTRALEGRNVNEHVRPASIRLDETEASLSVEKLNRAGRHR